MNSKIWQTNLLSIVFDLHGVAKGPESPGIHIGPQQTSLYLRDITFLVPSRMGYAG